MVFQTRRSGSPVHTQGKLTTKCGPKEENKLVNRGGKPGKAGRQPGPGESMAKRKAKEVELFKKYVLY